MVRKEADVKAVATYHSVLVRLKTLFFVSCLVALLTGPVLGREGAAIQDRADDASVTAEPESAFVDQEESWTWFGIGFENRRQGRGIEADAFGPGRGSGVGIDGSASSSRRGR